MMHAVILLIRDRICNTFDIGCLQYQGAPLEYTDLLSDCNLVFTILFTVECVMKLSCFGPKVCQV